MEKDAIRPVPEAKSKSHHRITDYPLRKKMSHGSTCANSPYECCKQDDGSKITVLDPNCVSHNSYCFRNMSILADEIRFENETMYGEFQTMMNKGKQATLAQLEASKTRVKFDMAEKQLELARARLKQHEFAQKAINLTTVRLREKLGLKLGEKMKNLVGKALISVDSLAFSVSMTRSSTKARFPLTGFVRTFEGSDKAIQFPMDFRKENDSLALASKLIVETMFGTSRSRRRRSAREELVTSKKNESTFPLEQHGCLFSQEAHIFFTDIVESLAVVIKNKKELEEAMAAGIRGLEELPGVEDKAGVFSTEPSQQIRIYFSDTIQYLKDAQLNNSGTISWNNTLNDFRGFLDVLSQNKNFTECSGFQDCTDYFFDSLEEMYEMEYHPEQSK
ncbi:hypothetical protein OS493_036241 [Desmophyllum pertusum]|uniref:Uncharacterized protein n=1 Tax=Desmophyllum pertusum TaxID=174260 RepID=A0A9X0D619_9CNID|nr:hypothetical protein OS493_036241 [Desmophyllum pertusum]